MIRTRVYVWRYQGKPRPIVAPDFATAEAAFLRNAHATTMPRNAEYLGAMSRQAYRKAWGEWTGAAKPADMGAFRNA